MGWNDHINETVVERDQALQFLLDYGYLSEKAAGITKLVMDGKSLSSKQQYVFEKEVEEEYLENHCEGCGEEVPLGELARFFDEGLCSRCSHRMSKDD